MGDGNTTRGIVEGAPEEPERSDLDLAKLPRNDIGNAERLVARRGADIVHVDNQGWFNFCGTHWRAPLAKKAPEVTAIAMEVVRRIRDEAIALQAEAKSFAEAMGAKPDKDDHPAIDEWLEQERRLKKMNAAAESHFKFANGSGNVGKVNAMQALAEPMRRAAADDLDRDPFLFNTPGGTLALIRPEAAIEGYTAGEALPIAMIATERPHDRADLITHMAGVSFDPEATCPRFAAFLELIMPDQAMRAYLQRLFGYCLTGDVSEQVYFLFWGEGSNGKSTLIRIIRAVMGSYAVKVPVATFLHNEHRKGGDTTPELLQLPGAHLAVCSEPPKNARLAEDMLKEISGGETMQARPLFQGMFEFMPGFKLIISFNPKPKLRDDSHGSWRRVQLVPFETLIPDDEKDKHFAERVIAEELAGILNWMIEGYWDWREGGLRPPAKVRDATEQYRRENDPIGEFLSLYVVAASGETIQSSHLYDVYVRWCIETSRDPQSKTAFSNRVKTAFKKAKSSEVYWQDVALNADGQALEGRIQRRPSGGEGSGGSAGGPAGGFGRVEGGSSTGDPREAAGWTPPGDA